MTIWSGLPQRCRTPEPEKDACGGAWGSAGLGWGAREGAWGSAREGAGEGAWQSARESARPPFLLPTAQKRRTSTFPSTLPSTLPSTFLSTPRSIFPSTPPQAGTSPSTSTSTFSGSGARPIAKLDDHCDHCCKSLEVQSGADNRKV